MTRILMLVLTMAIMAGCKIESETPVDPLTEKKAGVPLDTTPTLKTNIALNTGDVEQTIFLNITVAPQSRIPSIEIDEKADRRDMIRFSTITVHPPYPEELWFDVVLLCRNKFTNQPVVLRGRYLVDGEREVGELKYVLSGVNYQDYPMGSFNVLEPGAPLPETLLLTLDVEASLTEQDTKPETVNIDTFVAPEEMRTRALNSTAVRIKFVSEPAPIIQPEPDPEPTVVDMPSTDLPPMTGAPEDAPALPPLPAVPAPSAPTP